MSAHLAGEDDVVERGELPVRLDHAPFGNHEPAGRQLRQRSGEVLFLDARQVAEPAEVQSEQRHLGIFVHRPQERAVSAQDDDDVGRAVRRHVHAGLRRLRSQALQRLRGKRLQDIDMETDFHLLVVYHNYLL